MMQDSALITLWLIAGATLIAGTFGTIGAWAFCVLTAPPDATSNRSAAGKWFGAASHTLGNAFHATLIVSATIPLVLYAAGWESAAGKFGWLSMTQTGVRTDGGPETLLGGLIPPGAFTGLVAAIVIHGMHGIPIVILALLAGIRRIPPDTLQHARLDFGDTALWWRVQWPLARGWFGAALLLVALLAMTEMTVVNLYGVRTLAEEFYLYYAAAPSGTAALRVVIAPLCLGVFVWGLTRRRSRRRRRRRVDATDRPPPFTASSQPPSASPLTPVSQDAVYPGFGFSPVATRLGAATIVSVITAIASVPVLALLAKAGHTVVRTGPNAEIAWSPAWFFESILAAPATFGDEYVWTVLIGLAGGGTATVLAWVLSSLGQVNARLLSWIDLFTVLAFVIPGPVVGIAVVTFFQLPVPGFREAYQQSLLPTLIGVQFRAMPFAYWIFRAAYADIPPTVFDSAAMEMGRVRRFWQIDRPLTGRAAIGIWGFSGVIAAGDVPVLLPLLPPEVTTVGTRLFSLLHSGSRYQEAALAFWYLAGLLVVTFLAGRFTASLGRRRSAL